MPRAKDMSSQPKELTVFVKITALTLPNLLSEPKSD